MLGPDRGGVGVFRDAGYAVGEFVNNPYDFSKSSSIRRPDWATGGSQNRNVNLLSPTKLAGMEVAPHRLA
jgi:hypothetical protein